MAIHRILGNILNNDNLERSANLSFNNTLFFLDITENKVGINTDMPSSDLDVNGTITAGNIVIGNIFIPNVGNISTGGVTITNLPLPVANTDAATKQYVDSVVGPISDGNLVFNNTTISTIFTSSNITMVPTGTGNLVVAGTGNISGKNLGLSGFITANGNIQTSSYFIGDGSKLTNLNTSNIGLANVSSNVIPSANLAYTIGNSIRQWKEIWVGNTIYLGGVGLSGTASNLYVGTEKAVTQSANGQANVGYLRANGDVISTNGYFVGDGSKLTNINAANVTGSYSNANVASYLPVYTGTVRSGAFIGDGSRISNINVANVVGSYSNSNVANYLPIYNGNVSAFYLFGDGTYIYNIEYDNINNAYSNLNVADYFETFNGYLQAGVIVANEWFEGDGGNISNIQANNIIGAYGDSNVEVLLSSGNVTSNITTTGNISAGYFIGDGSNLSNLNIANAIGGYGNSNVASYLDGYVGNIIPSGNTVYSLGNITNQWYELWVSGNTIYIDGQPLAVNNNNSITFNGNELVSTSNTGVTNLGDLNVSGNANISNTSLSNGNITASFFIGDGSQLSNLNIANAIGGYGNSNVANYLPTYGGNFVADSITANSMSLGGTFAYTYSANTSSTSSSNIVSVSIGSYNSFNFNVTATDLTGNNCQVLKIIAATINGIMNYSEYGVVAIGNTIGSFDVTLSGNNLVLSVIPTTSNLVEYSILVSNYL